MKVVSKKNIKPLGTKKKKIINVDELNAYKVAYGKPLQTKEYFIYVGVPALVLGGLSFILVYYLAVGLIFGVIGAIYGVKVILPKSVEKQYESESFRQRNKFANNMTQILTDENKTVIRGLSVAKERAAGEFKEDLDKLYARLYGADNQQIRKGFENIVKKYEDDVIFVQYLEQLETATLEGRANIDTLKDIKTYHNDMKKKQSYYEGEKKAQMQNMQTLCGVIVILIFSVQFSFGFGQYIEIFAHDIIGWVTSGIYLFLMSGYFKKFLSYTFDDSILEVEV